VRFHGKGIFCFLNVSGYKRPQGYARDKERKFWGEMNLCFIETGVIFLFEEKVRAATKTLRLPKLT